MAAPLPGLEVSFPHDPLAAQVVCLWSLEHAQVRRRLLPDGCVRLVFDASPRSEGAWVIGPTTRETQFPERLQQALGATLRVGTAGSVLGVPLDELRDAWHPLEPLWGRAGVSALGAVLDQPDVPERLRGLESLLGARAGALRRWAAPAPAVELALHRLRSTGGQASVRELAAATGRSERTLERLFLERVGLAPKAVARVARLRSVLASLRGAPAPGWAALALDHGFADQAHLIREFRAMTGETPSAFVSRPDPLAQRIAASGFFNRQRSPSADAGPGL